MWATTFATSMDAFGRVVPLISYVPENVRDWHTCYKPWRNAAAVLEHVPPELLSHDPERVQTFADEYPEYL